MIPSRNASKKDVNLGLLAEVRASGHQRPTLEWVFSSRSPSVCGYVRVCVHMSVRNLDYLLNMYCHAMLLPDLIAMLLAVLLAVLIAIFNVCNWQQGKFATNAICNNDENCRYCTRQTQSPMDTRIKMRISYDVPDNVTGTY